LRLASLPQPGADAPRLRVGMVQSNIVDYERLRREMGAYAVVRKVLDTHYVMSREAVIDHRVDALLWAETVFPTTFAHPKSADGEALDDEIRSFAVAAGVPLVFGTYDLDADGEYNAAAFVDARGGVQGFYRKTRLFLFTEYVPPWLDGPTLRRLLPWAGTWRPGDGARVFPLRLRDGREVPVAALICLDDVDPGLAIDGARKGAQALLGLSNDSWFTAHPDGARLHLAVAAFRSIETRLPQLRVTNTGISAGIDPTGEVRQRTAMGAQALLVGEVAPMPPPATLMVRWGDWVGRTAALLLALFAAGSALRAWRSRRPRATAADDAVASNAHLAMAVSALSPPMRIAAATLRAIAGGGLLWMGLAWLVGDAAETGTLAQLRMFAGLVLAPTVAAWAIGRAGAATLRIEGDALVIDQRARRVEIPVAGLAALEPWRLPLPLPGAWLRLASGARFAQGLAGVDVRALAQALVDAGAPAALARAGDTRAALHAHARFALRRRWFDHPLVKFGLFPLLPALPAFRLHQIIAYGGFLGEYYTFGLKAWLLALLIWWASWAVGMTLYAAALRVPIEAGAWIALLLKPGRAVGVRRALEIAGRLLYYLGAPALLLLRVLQG
ncbi:MAG: apolipoprotein N-acyltransferase, partial [Lysobacteraceae bacterium]